MVLDTMSSLLTVPLTTSVTTTTTTPPLAFTSMTFAHADYKHVDGGGYQLCKCKPNTRQLDVTRVISDPSVREVISQVIICCSKYTTS